MSLREMMNASMEDIHSQASPDLCVCWNDQCVPDPSCLHYIISRYSACLSGRGCYQSRTHSEDERGINTQALEPCSYSQRWPVSFQPKSFILAYMIHDCYSGFCVKISAISPSAIISLCGSIWNAYMNEITTQICKASKKKRGGGGGGVWLSS